jgi:hypothetical protein
MRKSEDIFYYNPTHHLIVISTVRIDNNFIIVEQHYSKGHIFLSKTFMIDSLLLSESRYSNDGTFELRQYYCQGKILISESILYKATFMDW